MAKVISKATIVSAAGQPPKRIEEFIRKLKI
jgi:hypothetical protein